MTRIQEIRPHVEQLLSDLNREDHYNHADIAAELAENLPAILTAWDTRDAALRSLVQQWREEAEANLKEASEGSSLALHARAFALEECADQLDARLAEV